MPELSAQPLPKDRRDARRGPMDQTLGRDLNGMNLSHSVAGHRGDIPFYDLHRPQLLHGHVGLIQRNAITSWKRLRPACQVIMCGDEAGCERIAAELGRDRIPAVDCNEFGTPLLSSVFALAEAMAESDLLLLRKRRHHPSFELSRCHDTSPARKQSFPRGRSLLGLQSDRGATSRWPHRVH